ncbi:MAG: hypothetical protein KKC19_00640 [Nanoarchaeota archaeon]|nr:hypothetical protein [Nanoarchaeota archaeon]
MKIKRRCVVCGKNLIINVNEDRTYDNGHYFGKMKFPVGKGKNVKVGTTKMFGRKMDVVQWNGKEKK